MNKKVFVALAFLLLCLSGCASSSIPKEKQKDYAFLDVGANFDLVARLAYIVMVDQQTYSRSPLGTSRDVLPGRHDVKVDACDGNAADLLAQMCYAYNYVFDAKAGFAYKFNNSYSIDVYDRFDLNKPLDKLIRVNSVFVTLDEAKQFSAKQQKVMEAQEARRAGEMEANAAALAVITERKRNNLPLVRKVGARICQEQDQERGQVVIYVGYVEALAEEKVQIRVSGAHYKNMPTARPGGFSPSIIWDSPMNWDLCE